MTRPQCALGRLIPSTPDVERIKREAWQDGWLVVHIDDDRLSWDQREYVRQIGNEINARVDRPDAALSRQVRSDDGLCVKRVATE